MIILHKDHSIYEPPEGWCVPDRYLWETISGFYYLKFQEIFEENNLEILYSHTNILSINLLLNNKKNVV